MRSVKVPVSWNLHFPPNPMPESLPRSITRLADQYIDGTRYTSCDEVLFFAMNLFGEFERRYAEHLGASLRAAFDGIGNGRILTGQDEITAYFDQLMLTDDGARSVPEG